MGRKPTDLVEAGEGEPADELVGGVGALPVLRQPRHSPHDGPVLMLVFGSS